VSILLVPVQGEQWAPPPSIEGAVGQPLRFPTPAIMMKHFGKWFPHLSSATFHRITKLYGGGEYTESRTVHHTLMHYKSFERLLVARCGMSIRMHRQLSTLLARGGASIAEQTVAVMALVSEGNSLQSQLKSPVSYDAVLERVSDDTANAHTDLHRMSRKRLMIAELVSLPDGSHLRAATHSPQAFGSVVAALRLRTETTVASGLRMSAAMEQWVLMRNESEGIQSLAEAAEALSPISEALTVLVGFLQVSCSLRVTFPDLPYPEELRALLAFWGFVNFDFFDLHWAAAFADGVHFANTTLLLLFAFLAFILAIPTAYKLVTWRHVTRRRQRQALYDRSVGIAVLGCFLLYPILSARLLKLFNPERFGAAVLLKADKQITYDSKLSLHHVLGAVFIVLYIVGIPAFFLQGLWKAARPTRDIDVNRAGVTRQLRRQQRLVMRYGLLYTRYRPDVWWWELIELSRKLLLISALSLVGGGEQAQLLFALGVSLLALLLHSHFQPFSRLRMNFLNFAALLSTLLTLFVALLIRSSPSPPASPVADILICLQLVPILVFVWLLISAIRKIVLGYQIRLQVHANLPAVLRDEPPEASAHRGSVSTRSSVVSAVRRSLSVRPTAPGVVDAPPIMFSSYLQHNPPLPPAEPSSVRLSQRHCSC